MLITQEQSLLAINGQATQQIELRKSALERESQLAEAMLPVTARVGERIALQAQVAAKRYQVEADSLALQRQQGGLSQVQYDLAKQKLTEEYKLNVAMDRRLAMAQEQAKLDDQIRSNIGSAFSGVRKLLTDTSIWEQFYNPEGDSYLERHRNRVQAIRNLVTSTVNPIFETIYDRLIENLYSGIVDSLTKLGPFKDLFGMPEMQQNANLMSVGIRDASRDGALMMGREIRAAVTESLGPLMPQMRGPSLPTATPQQARTMATLTSTMRAVTKSVAKSGVAVPGVSAGTPVATPANAVGALITLPAMKIIARASTLASTQATTQAIGKLEELAKRPPTPTPLTWSGSSRSWGASPTPTDTVQAA